MSQLALEPGVLSRIVDTGKHVTERFDSCSLERLRSLRSPVSKPNGSGDEAMYRIRAVAGLDKGQPLRTREGPCSHPPSRGIGQIIRSTNRLGEKCLRDRSRGQHRGQTQRIQLLVRKLLDALEKGAGNTLLMAIRELLAQIFSEFEDVLARVHQLAEIRTEGSRANSAPHGAGGHIDCKRVAAQCLYQLRGSPLLGVVGWFVVGREQTEGVFFTHTSRFSRSPQPYV